MAAGRGVSTLSARRPRSGSGSTRLSRHASECDFERHDADHEPATCLRRCPPERRVVSTGTQISPRMGTENSPPPGSLRGLGGADEGGRGEEHAVATLDGLEAEPDGEMGLAHPGRPEDYQVLPVLDEATHAKGLDLLAVDGRLIAEVETVQALDEGEAGELGAHGDMLGGLGGDFLREDLVEEVGKGALLGRGVLEKGLDALATFEQPETLQGLLQPLD